MHQNSPMNFCSNLQYLFDGKKKIFFFHLPKTAGASLTAFIESQFLYSQIFHLENDPDATTREKILNISNDPNIIFISGHFFMSEFLDNEKYVTITIVRNPIERLKSLYRWFIKYDMRTRMSDIAKQTIIKAKSSTMLNFFKSPHVDFLFSQMQCFYGDNKFQNDYNTNSALENLNTVNFVGTTETIKEFSNIIAFNFNFVCSDHIQQLNRTSELTEIENEVDSFLENKLTEEISIYTHCIKLFNLLKRRHIISFFVPKFRHSQSIYYDSNWYPWEKVNGRWMRWSYAGRSSKIYFNAKGLENKTIQIEICDFVKTKLPHISWERGLQNGNSFWDGYKAKIKIENNTMSDILEIAIINNDHSSPYIDHRLLGTPIWCPTLLE